MKKITLIFTALLLNVVVFSQNSYDVTPISKNNKSEKKATKLSEEELFVSTNFPTINIADWTNGMKFMYELKPSKYSTFPLKKYNPKKKKNSSIDNYSPLDYAGKIFTVVTVEERVVDCPRGNCIRTYVIFENDGVKYEYEFFDSKSELRTQDPNLSVINGLTYLNDIDKAKELLLNKDLYILTTEWKTTDDEGKTKGIKKQKFTKIRIVNVGIGWSKNPVRLVFTVDSGDTYFIDIRLSETNLREITGKTSIKYLRNNFAERLSFSNPYDNYPDIKPEIWSIIQEEKVRVGMTAQECILSWGEPDDINKTISGSSVSEQWVYDSGSYLYFEDGILTTIQN